MQLVLTSESREGATSREGMAIATPQRKERYLALDGLRGVAATIVVIFHCSYIAGGNLFPYGWLAVDLFFILSGFVLAHAYLGRFENGMTVGAFLKERLVRLYPMYFVGLLLGVISLIGIYTDWRAISLGAVGVPYLNDGTFRIGEDLRIGHIFPFNAPAWSLFFEGIINIVFAICCVRRINLRWIFAVSFVWLGWHYAHGGRLLGGWVTGNVAIGFIRVGLGFPLGVMLYKGLIRVRPYLIPREYPGWIPSAIMTALLAVLMPFQHQSPYLLFLILIAFPLLVVVGANAKVGTCAGELFGWLGAISYPLYAIHMPVIQVCSRVFPSITVAMIFAPVVSLILADALARWVDPWARNRLKSLLVGKVARLPT